MRIGNKPDSSVADAQSRVHGCPNLWVGGNGCLPDATGTNPTRTSVRLHMLFSFFRPVLTVYFTQVAIAIEGARSVISYIAGKI